MSGGPSDGGGKVSQTQPFSPYNSNLVPSGQIQGEQESGLFSRWNLSPEVESGNGNDTGETEIMKDGDSFYIKDFAFEDVHVKIVNDPRAARRGGIFDLRPAFDESLGWLEHDMPAMFCRRVEGLRIRNTELVLKSSKGFDDYTETAY